LSAEAGQIGAIVQPGKALRRDTLLASVVFLVVLSCIQPLVTFLRGVIFCRLLEPQQLGCWDVALGFLTIVAPIVVFGIPGSFGRYVEHYAQKGQLRMFLRRTTGACIALGVAAVATIVLFAPTFSYLMFAQDGMTELVYLIAVGLTTMIAFGFSVELLTALRMFRIVAVLQFIKGLTFVLGGAALLILWQAGPESVILGHMTACLLPTVISLWWLAALWKSLPASARPGDTSYVTHRELWARFLPFALGIWMTNFFSNLFAIVDRYMILHFGNMSPSEALEQVGHYHSSRIVPLLLLAFTEMLAGIVLPHLSRNWEAGHRKEVGRQVVFGLKLCALALTAGAAAVMLLSQPLFEIGFRGRYNGGLAVLPWTLVYTSWFGMYTVIQKYIWCAERIRLCIVSLVAGIIVNICLNLVLLPYLGLLGAVLATAASKLVVVVMICSFNCWLGMQFDWRIVPMVLLPLAVCLGAPAALAILAVVGLAILSTQLVLTKREKRELVKVVQPARRKIFGDPA
jgi:O-antigen/teichoic acid export membrane protein